MLILKTESHDQYNRSQNECLKAAAGSHYSAFISLLTEKRKQCHEASYLCQLWGFYFLYLEEVANGEEGYGHSADTDHKDDQRRTATDVRLQVLQRVD